MKNNIFENEIKLTNKEEDFILEEDRERDFEDLPDKDETVYSDELTEKEINQIKTGVNHPCELGEI